MWFSPTWPFCCSGASSPTLHQRDLVRLLLVRRHEGGAARRGSDRCAGPARRRTDCRERLRVAHVDVDVAQDASVDGSCSAPFSRGEYRHCLRNSSTRSVDLLLGINRRQCPRPGQRVAGEEPLVQHLPAAERRAGDVPRQVEQLDPVARAACVRSPDTARCTAPAAPLKSASVGVIMKLDEPATAGSRPSADRRS